MIVEIGQVLKPRGLKGELKVEMLYNRPQVFTDLKTVFIRGQKYNVLKGSVQNGFAYLNLQGIDQIEKAEPLRNQMIGVETADLHLQANEILSSELVGFQVYQNGKLIGRVQAVENYGAGDFFEIALTGSGYAEIPNEDDFILETNVQARTLTLTPNALEEELV